MERRDAPKPSLPALSARLSRSHAERLHFDRPRIKMVSVQQEDIPVLLQYYNPEMIPHTGLPEDPPYEFYFNEEGDFDFTYGYEVMPGPMLMSVSSMLKEGLLEEERTTIKADLCLAVIPGKDRT